MDWQIRSGSAGVKKPLNSGRLRVETRITDMVGFVNVTLMSVWSTGQDLRHAICKRQERPRRTMHFTSQQRHIICKHISKQVVRITPLVYSYSQTYQIPRLHFYHCISKQIQNFFSFQHSQISNTHTYLSTSSSTASSSSSSSSGVPSPHSSASSLPPPPRGPAAHRSLGTHMRALSYEPSCADTLRGW